MAVRGRREDFDVHGNRSRNSFLAVSQSMAVSFPSATRCPVSCRTFACQAGNSMPASCRLKSYQRASINRSFSGTVIFSSVISIKLNDLVIGKALVQPGKYIVQPGLNLAARVSVAVGRVGLGDGFVQCGQAARVTLIALVGPVCAPLFLHKSSPRLQGEAAEFIRIQLVPLRFNFGKAHGEVNLFRLACEYKPDNDG